MGGRAAVREWQGGNVWRLVRGSNAISGGHRQATAPCGHLPQCHRVELSRRLDVPGRRVRTMVQRVLEHGTSDEHDAAAGAIRAKNRGMGAETAGEHLSRSGGAL